VSGIGERIAPARLGTTFRWLIASSWVANLGDGFSLAAGPLLIASRTHNPVLVSLAAFMQWVPGFAFGLYAGALADRTDRRSLVLRMNLVRALALAALTATIIAHVASVEVILAALFVLGLTDTFVNTASGAILPMVVDKQDLGVANARFTFGWVGLSQLIGPPVGAALFAIGASWPFASETICGLAGSLLFTRVVLAPHGREKAARRRVRHEIVEGLRWTRDNAAMRVLVIQILTFNVTYGASWSVLVLYSRERLGLGTVGFGLLTVATALGSVLGTMTYGWLEKHVRLADIMRYGLVLETGTHFVLAVTRSPAVAMAILFLFGIHIAYWATTASSVRQRAVPADLQGRVGSVYTFALLGGLVVGSAVGGLLASRFGITAPYWFGFAGCAVILLAIWRPLGHVAHTDATAVGRR
jgi:MFS family permease